jgi:3-deoxy-D-manno-octulosonic-acid transferase
MGIFLLLLYNFLAPVIALSYLAFFLLSRRRGLLKNLANELSERLAITPPVLAGRPLWIHAASLGEVRAVSLLVPFLKARYPSHPVLVTTSTASGRAEALRLTPNARLLPLDSYPLMRRFISAVRPELLIIAETELWPNLLCAAGKSGVGIVMINARISSRTLSFYRLLAPAARLIFANIGSIAAQSRADLERYKLLPGVTDKLVLTGNLKHDLVAQGPQDRAAIETFLGQTGWKGKKIFCAGSTHPAEEDRVLDAFLKIRAAVPDARLILAPRHPETARSSADKLRKRTLVSPLWSQRAHARPGPDCLLIDETGRLSDIYYFSDVVFVGGTLDDTGGHNVLEPSAFSKPVLFGPNIKHTREGAEALINKNGGFMVKTTEELADKTISLLKDPSALQKAGAASKAALESLQGSTGRTLAVLKTVLHD